MDGLDSILNFTPLDARLASSGQPRAEQFPLVAAHGFTAVINLATEASTGHLTQEPQLWAGLGVDFTWRPVDWKAPTQDDYHFFQDWLDAHRAGKALVHCAMNWRASMFCALYRVIREDLPYEDAREAVLDIWEPDDTWTSLSRDILAAHGREPIVFKP